MYCMLYKKLRQYYLLLGPVVSVCNGDQLEFTCTTTDPDPEHRSFSVLLWNITLITVTDDAPMSYTQYLSSSSPSD